MPKFPFRPLLSTLLLTACLPPALAQTAPDAGQILREQKPPAPSRPSLAPEIRLTPPAPAPAASSDGPRFTLRAVELIGIDEGEQALFSEILQNAIGTEKNLADLQALAQQLAERYRAAGWALAAAWLPPQTIRHGEAKIHLRKGQLSASELQGHPHPGAQRLLAALPTHAALESSTLERTLLLIEEQPGVRAAQFELSPGTSEGTSQLRLTLPDPGPGHSHRLSADNHGSYYSGQTRLGLRTRLDNPLNLSDRLDLSLIGSEGNTWSEQIDWNTLLASNGLRGGLRIASVRYELGETYKKLDAHGIANTLGANLSAPLWRRFGAALDLGLEYEHRWLSDKNNIAEDNNKEIDNLTLSLSGQLRDAGGVSAWSLGSVLNQSNETMPYATDVK